jgi:hypothetical protein
MEQSTNMNAKTKPAEEAKQQTTALAAAPAPGAVALATPDFEADAGSGMEGTTQDSFAIPFLSVLQTNSPQVDESMGEYIAGAKAGMFYDNVTRSIVDGKVGITVVPCAYRRVFLRWTPRGAEGSGFKGEMSPEEVAELRAKGAIKEMEGRLFFPLPDGTINEKKCDRVSDTRNHYVLITRGDGGIMPALLSLTSTQIKKSKQLMSALAGVRKTRGDGSTFQPPTFANLVKLTTVPEQNDKGKWHGVRPELVGFVDRQDVYAAAKAFHDSVAKGQVEARYEATGEEAAGTAPAQAGSGGGNF